MSTGFSSHFARKAAMFCAFALSAAFTILPLAGSADARLGGGGSFGSRGTRTFSSPSATSTAPRVAPIERSQTAAPFNGGSTFGARPGLFGGGGFGRGLLGGFLGAGLFGLFFGGSLFGGLGGGFSMIGLLLQIGLLYLAFRFIMGFFRRQQPAFGGSASMFGGGTPVQGGGYGSAPQRGVPITIGPDDYQAFEQRLIQSQAAYSNANSSVLRQVATPEMYGNFANELAANERQGVVNRLADVRLLQGDLSEAWREGSAEYASVAMRFSLIDSTVERSTGRVVSGDPGTAQEVTEVWTFTRPSGAGANGWLLSAIQQA